jgi:hypothetical protein
MWIQFTERQWTHGVVSVLIGASISYSSNSSLTKLFTDSFSVVYLTEKWPEITFKTTLIICHMVTILISHIYPIYTNRKPFLTDPCLGHSMYLSRSFGLLVSAIRFTCSQTRVIPEICRVTEIRYLRLYFI